jgi:hypothetical protein
MLEGWRRQQSARRLSVGVVDGRERLVRRFQAFTVRWMHQAGADWTSYAAELAQDHDPQA